MEKTPQKEEDEKIQLLSVGGSWNVTGSLFLYGTATFDLIHVPSNHWGTSSTESRHKSQVGRRCWEDDQERNIRWLIVFFFGQLFYYNNKNTRVGCLDCSLVNPLFRKILCWSLDPRTAQSTNWSATRLYGQWPLDHCIELCRVIVMIDATLKFNWPYIRWWLISIHHQSPDLMMLLGHKTIVSGGCACTRIYRII